MKNIFCRGVLLLLVATSTMVFGQTKPLKIGDAIPATVWTTPLQVVNAPQKTTTLSADKGKLILLDFWNTWCSACLLYFPKMEKLKEQFSDKVKILAVGDQDRATLEKFFATTNGQRYKSTVSVAGDKMFNSLFPHRGVPYVVWIKDGKLYNTTDIDQVNDQNITDLLNSKVAGLQTVIQMGRDRPLMLSENYDLEKGTRLLHYSFFSKGRIRGMAFGSGFHRDNGVVVGRQFTNLPLFSIIKGISYELFSQIGETLNNKRIINQVEDVTLIDFNIESEKRDDKLFNYELIVPTSQAPMLYTQMLQGLNDYSGYNISIEKKFVKCLVLQSVAKGNKLSSKGGDSIDNFFKTPSVMQNVPLDFLLSNLNATTDITPLLVVDETQYTGNVDLQFTTPLTLTTLQKDLLKYDLEMIESVRELPMLIIKDRK